MLYYVGFHAEDLPEQDRPTNHSIPMPRAQIDTALENLRKKYASNFYGEKERDDQTYQGYLIQGILVTLADDISAAFLIGEEKSDMRSKALLLKLPLPNPEHIKPLD